MQLNLPPLAVEARLQMDIKATITVAMAVAMYYICYIPPVVFSIQWSRIEDHRVANLWSAFMLAFTPFVSGALNPVIYVSRNRRNRSAIRQLLKDPCGRSAYRENPGRGENGAKRTRIEPQIEGEGCKDRKGPATTVRALPNPGSDAKRPSTAKLQIYQSHSVVKVAWKKNEVESNSLEEQVAVVEQPRRGAEKVQDAYEEGASPDSARDEWKKKNAAVRKETGASPEESSDLIVHQYSDCIT